MAVLQIRLTDEQHGHLAAIAATEGLSLSEFARRLLFEEHPRNPNAVTFIASDELLDWMLGRAEVKNLALDEYVRSVIDNVRRQWVAQSKDPELQAVR
jgi:Antitoxin ParD